MQARDADGSGDFDDAWLRDEVVTLMLAGHKTTGRRAHLELASAEPAPGDRAPGPWGRRQRAAQRARADFDELERLPYARQVVEEAMRLYPPIWAMERRALEEDEIGGFTIPKGGTVIVASYVMSSAPGVLGASPSASTPSASTAARCGKAPADSYAYLPFGSGPRVCIGMSFALAEATLLLATVIRQSRLLQCRKRR